MRSCCRSLVSLFLAVVLPASMLMAETDGAILRASGQALLNGTSVNRNSAVLPGDLVNAPAGSTVSISSTGSTVVLPGNSSLKYDGSSISLQSGQALVTTANGMKAKVDAITVSPADKSARYEVTKDKGKVMIAALNGSVAISDATHAAMLTEGYMTTIDPQADSRVPSPGVNNDRQGWGMSRKKAIVLLSVGAGAAAIIAYWLSASPEPLSGQRPNSITHPLPSQ